MAIVDLGTVEQLDADDIASDPRNTTRRSEWYFHLEAVAEKFVSGEFEAGKYVKLANFDAPSGARVKTRQLCTRALPGAEGWEWSFMHTTWIGDDAKRHSSLFATFAPVDETDEVDEVEGDEQPRLSTDADDDTY
jgi:hypothetical protein